MFKITEKQYEYLLKYYIKKKSNFNFIDKLKLKYAIIRLKNSPIQYVVKNVDFYGYIYKVNKNTLIPRFETEQLVEETLKIIKNKFKENIKTLDVGTGSGCIGLTIKRLLPKSEVTLTDISRKALKIAKKNAKNLDVTIIKTNLYDKLIKTNKKFNVIISNPPYISSKENIDDLVKKYEPKKALYASEDGLYYYKRILKNINKILEKDYIIAFEIGYKQAKKIKKIAEKYIRNCEVLIKKDLQQRDRMLFIYPRT